MLSIIPKFQKSSSIFAMTALWLANPILGGCEPMTYTFEKADMVLLMETLNQQTWIIESDTQNYEVDLQILESEGEYASHYTFDVISSAHACGTRSFIASADACISDTIMELEGWITIRDAQTQEILVEEKALDGEMYVLGYDLNNADVRLFFAEEGSIDFYSPDGQSFSLQALRWE
ncbi:MAG: hypothetical protein VX278_17555 [Myxococcota bacterium]|nr:hypothetical protein [Myxococcota bacterium]